MKKQWTLSSFYHGSWASMLALAAVLSWQSELFPLPLVGLSLLFSLWCLVPKGRFRRPAFPLSLRLAAIALLVGPVVAEYTRTKDLASLLGSGLWASLLLFLPRKQKSLGHWIALLVTGLVALMGVIVKQEFSTHVVFLVFLLNLVFTLNANNLYTLAGASGAVRYRLSVRYFRQLVPALFWGFAGGGLVFFLFPRTQLFTNPWGLREREASTGYTGKISLQNANAIREDATVALTVEASPQWLLMNAQTLYLRGNTLDRFDGTQWTSTETERWPYRPGDDVRYSMSHSGSRIGARIYREPHSTRAILYPGMLLFFRGPEGLLGGTRFDAARSLFRSNSGSLRYSYEVMVGEEPGLEDLDRLSFEDFRSRWEGERRRGRAALSNLIPGPEYLQLPAAVSSARYFTRWSEQVLKGAPKATLGEVVLALSRNFARNFTPTLTHETSAPTAMEGFLGQSKKGHCEYFATAAALFLRAQGIPSRVVLGYRGGTFNTVSRTLEVRERNAHAWVEIYGGRGRWYRYDPTPAMPILDDSGLVAEMGLYYNAIKFWFNRYVVHYDSGAQQQVWMQVALMRGHRFDGLPRWQAFIRVGRWLAFFIAAWLTMRVIRRRRRLAEDSLPGYYRLFLSRLAKAGWLRAPGETFRRFHERLSREGWDVVCVDKLDAALHRDLYSPRPLAAEEGLQLRQWVSRLPIQKKVASGPRSS
jgi:transglutaminase-like putative cysteine protease